jgi:CRP-like cAMP-binding protein
MVGGDTRVDNPLAAKLSCFAPLTQTDLGVLARICSHQERFSAGINLLNEGEPPRSAFVMTQGLACRYRVLADGSRQILTFLLPGDFFDLHAFLLKAMDHSVVTLMPTRLAAIRRETVTTLIANHPRIAAAIWRSEIQEAAIMRERIVMLGRHNARARIAYILCELVWRERLVGVSEDHAMRLPLTQADIADTLGLTPVHVNRVLQEFRRDRLITLSHRQLVLQDMDRLQSLAELTSDYLHLDGMPTETARYIDNLERAQQ